MDFPYPLEKSAIRFPLEPHKRQDTAFIHYSLMCQKDTQQIANYPYHYYNDEIVDSAWQKAKDGLPTMRRGGVIHLSPISGLSGNLIELFSIHELSPMPAEAKFFISADYMA